MSKKENYTEEQTTEMVKAYQDCETQEDRDNCVLHFADKFGKVPASVRMKLVREKVYIAKEYKSKTGDPVERKENIVQNIADALNVTPKDLGGLQKATKAALTKIREALPKPEETVSE